MLRVQNLSLTNFRSYRKAAFEFADRSVLVGQNTAGKTNLLEAIYLISSTKSFRADREREMISWGENQGNVTVQLDQGGAKHVVSVGLSVGSRNVSKIFMVDHSKTKPREIVTTCPATLFSADDTRLIDGSPGRRRRALDLALSQSSRRYYENLARYGKVLASRNRLLEQIQSNEAGVGELDFWDGELIDSGQAVVDERQRFTAFLSGHLSGLYHNIANLTDTGRLEVVYQPLVTEMASEIPRRREQDMAIGTTSGGPHRDDWSLLLGNRPLASFGSGGEFRSAMLAFRMAETTWITAQLGIQPVLLLDDVFSELDEFRREALLETLPMSQVIITTPEAGILPKHFAREATITPIIAHV